MSAMRAGLDATPLLGPRTGVGRYVAGLVGALAALAGGPELVLVPFTWRGAAGLPGVAPAAARVRCCQRRFPARALHAAWRRGGWPPVEWLAGRVDVFHGTNFVAPPTRRAGLAVTIHDLTYLRYPELVTAASASYRELVPRGLARGAVVCTPTAAIAAEVAEAYRLPAERVVVTPLGVDPAWSTAAPPDPGWLARLGLPREYLLFVGSREPRKGLPVLLDALRLLRAGGQDVPPLALVGPPGWGAALDLGGLPEGAVVTTGYLDGAALMRVVAGATLFAFPSLYEGFGLPPLEALACGVPVVASDVPALREVLADQAELVPPGDAEALAAAIAKELDQPADPERAAARRARAARFTWAACAAATLEAYRRAA